MVYSAEWDRGHLESLSMNSQLADEHKKASTD